MFVTSRSCTAESEDESCEPDSITPKPFVLFSPYRLSIICHYITRSWTISRGLNDEELS